MMGPENGSETKLRKQPSVEHNVSSEEKTELKRELGLLDGVSIIVGIIVGSGIFVSPKGVLLHAGSIGMSLIVWVFSGLLSMVGALCYAELGTLIPRSGGDYAYIGEAFGDLPSFLYLWSALLMIMPAGNAIISLTFANYILQPFYPACEPDINAVRLIAASVICLLTAVNCYNVKSVTWVQDIFTAGKILALVTIIVSGLVWLAMGLHVEESLNNPFRYSKLSVGDLSMAFYSGIFSYAGWNYLNFVTEELREPNKNLPRAIYISMPLITTIYCLANLAYFIVLQPTEILASNAVAVTYGDRLLGGAAWLMPLFVAFSTFGSVNGGIFASSRLFFVGARKGHMPRAMALINFNKNTPMPCLIILGVITLLMLATDNVYVLIGYTAFVESFFTAVSVAGLLYLRWKRPEAERPIKVNLFLPIVFLLLCGFLVVFPLFGDEPELVGVAMGIIFSGVPVFLIFVAWKSKPRWLMKLSNQVDESIQKTFLAIPDFCE